MLLYQIVVCTKHGKTKNASKNHKFRISSTTWSEKFGLPYGSYLCHIFKIILRISLINNIIKLTKRFNICKRLAKNMGKNTGKYISKNLSSNYSQNLFQQPATDAFKNASKRFN